MARRIRNIKRDMSDGFNIKQRSKLKPELVGSKRTITLKGPILNVAKTNYYRVVNERKS
ncbi:hypothetical protein [Ferroplasma acidiphilum]|jgi:hypothetical protein|uniref:Uncharacterized protein n=1 Tax=Ferroplasma acidiphilum TaxID=74969 RepID=A0A7K4FP11_9ARCH|nr:hypothetical protein [Ferroplasma acidiphilum]NOL60665.1 hypothetical protein [Ferroplasma acidiphilum]